MITVKSEPAQMSKLTTRQRETYRLRHQDGATIEQIADWLRISPRAVFYRLQCAHRRLGEAADPPGESADRPRTYVASQRSGSAQGASQDIDDL